MQTLGAEHACQTLSQLGLRFVVRLHEHSQKLWWKAIAQYALSEQAHSASVDPSTEGLRMVTNTIQSDLEVAEHVGLVWCRVTPASVLCMQFLLCLIGDQSLYSFCAVLVNQV